jgi:hypothetical protein
MDIQLLRILVREGEINELLLRYVPPEAAVQNLHVRLTPDGVVVAGDYPTFMVKMAFETLWAVSAADGKVLARLGSVKVAGLPAGMLRGVLLRVIRDATAQQQGIHVEGEAISIDVGEVLKSRQIPVGVQVTAVRCGAGELTIEAGNPV